MHPLILTLSLDQESFLYFNELRRAYFPPERNFIDAHVTLFHHLQNDDQTIKAVRQAALAQPVFTLIASDVISLGRGVAFYLNSNELIHLHKTLQQQFSGQLTPQDQQKLRPHVTIQNKVSVVEAQQLLAQLKSTFKPLHVTATGLQLWEYLGGPWKLAGQFDFVNS